MIRRTEMEDMDSFLERQCFNLNPEMWTKIYKDRILGQLDANDGGLPLTEADLDDLDAYMAQQEESWKRDNQEQAFQGVLSGKHTMSGASPAAAKAPLVWGDVEAGSVTNQLGKPLRWGPWQ